MDSRPVPRLVISGPMKLEMPNMSRQVLAPANIRYGTMPLKPFRPKPSSVIKNGIISTPNIWNRPTIAEFSAEVLNPWSTRYAPPVIVVRPAPPHEQGVASPKRATAMATSGSNLQKYRHHHADYDKLCPPVARHACQCFLNLPNRSCALHQV